MRRAPLARDPEKLRAWNEKHRKAFAPRQAPPKPRGGLAPGKRRRRLTIPPETRSAARARSGGKCVACLYWGHAGRGHGKAVHLHHALPVQRWPMLVAVEDVLVGVCFKCHNDHEHGGARVPLLALPECVFRLAADVGPAAVDYLLRTYPESGGPPGRQA